MQLDAQTALDLPLLEGSGALGVAVSGGGDSVALLHLLKEWGGRELAVVTVDHGLRAESAEEADAVGVLAASMGISHAILKWEGWDKRGNTQDAARTARRTLIAAWAARNGVTDVALGHTADDQAETFLMRLARGSGVDGLASMEPKRSEDGVVWLRPLLGVRREALRTYLAGIGAKFFDDPSNEDESFDRVKVRRALGTLGALGIDVPKISQTTQRLRSAKQVVYTATRDLSLACTTVTEAGELIVDTTRLQSGQAGLQLRILSEAVRFVAGSYYTPRAYMVQNVLDSLGPDFQAATLHGCIIRAHDAGIVIRREPEAIEEAVPVSEIWDGRWAVTGPSKPGDLIKALGEAGLAQCKDWREAGLARETLLTSPSVWRNDTLIAAPFAGFGSDFSAKLSLINPFFAV